MRFRLARFLAYYRPYLLPYFLPFLLPYLLPYLAPCFLLAAGCGEITPPLDQLPLRDTLRADPQVVAALDDGARQNLADRLLLMRGGESADDPVDDPAATPQDLVARLDRARERRGQDALVAGALEGSTVVHALSEVAPDRIQLPPLESDAAPAPSPTLEIESRALAGRARIELGALLARSGAHHLQRVVGWPVGAIAIGDRIYVNAAWLVALAPGQPGDGGADAGRADESGARGAAAPDQIRAPAQSGAQSDGTPAPPPPYDGGVAVVSALSGYDGGVYTPPPQPPQPPPPVSSGDDCAAACASSGDDCGSSSGDDCSSTDDGSSSDCSSTDDGSGSDCSSSGDSGGSCETSADEGEGCAIARSRRHQGKGTLLTLAMPLAFLLPRRRR